jgi:hypothetical protein
MPQPVLVDLPFECFLQPVFSDDFNLPRSRMDSRRSRSPSLVRFIFSRAQGRILEQEGLFSSCTIAPLFEHDPPLNPFPMAHFYTLLTTPNVLLAPPPLASATFFRRYLATLTPLFSYSNTTTRI